MFQSAIVLKTWHSIFFKGGEEWLDEIQWNLWCFPCLMENVIAAFKQKNQHPLPYSFFRYLHFLLVLLLWIFFSISFYFEINFTFSLILSNINIMWNGENEENCDKTESHFIFEVRLCNYWNCKYWNWMFNECNQQSLSLWCFSLKLNVNVINKFYC